MDITTITFKEGGDVEFLGKQPEFFNTDGVDFIGVGIGKRKEQEKVALAKAASFGHKLSDFATSYGDRSKAYSEAYCLNGDGNCPMVAAVNVKAPEGRQIGGTATILKCEASPTSNE